MSKKGILILALIVLVGGFVAYEQFNPGQQNNTPAVTTKQTPTTGDNNPPQQTTPPQTQTTTGFKNGTYTGDETSSIYGKAKAQIVVKNGKITDVTFPEFPSDRQASARKSDMAMPIIKQEVIQAQSANVNTVSGATETSASFIQSIASAIAKAV